MDLFFLPAFLWRKILLRRSVVLESPLLMLLGIQYSITLSEIAQRPSQLNLEKTCTQSTRRPKTFGLELHHCTGMLSGLVQNLLEKIFDLPTLVHFKNRVKNKQFDTKMAFIADPYYCHDKFPKISDFCNTFFFKIKTKPKCFDKTQMKLCPFEFGLLFTFTKPSNSQSELECF